MKPLYVLAALALTACSPTTPTSSASTPAPTASGTASGPAAVATGVASGGTLDVTLDGAPLTFDAEPVASLQANDVYMNFNRGNGDKAYVKLRLSNNDRWKTPVVVPALTNGTQAQCEVGLGSARDSYWASRQGSGTDEGSKLEVKAGRLVGTWKYHSKAWQDLGGGRGDTHNLVVTIDMALPNGLQ